jgi:hypothetical protein
MARAYTIATAALALNTSTKWLDNVLSHYTISGVSQGRQGISRRLNVHALLSLRVILTLTDELGIPTIRAIKIAETIVANEGQFVSPVVSLKVDWATFQANLIKRLENAVEIAPSPNRGRPRENKTGRLE